jgi:hypothetical protein
MDERAARDKYRMVSGNLGVKGIGRGVYHGDSQRTNKYILQR